MGVSEIFTVPGDSIPRDARIAGALEQLTTGPASLVQYTTWMIFLVYFDAPCYTWGHHLAGSMSRTSTMLDAAIAQGAADDAHTR
jgi:hypothetical protein